MTDKQLTPKQLAFAEAFNANGGNATAAYRAIYDCRNMNPSSVHKEAGNLTRHPGVSELIAGTQEHRAPMPKLVNPEPADVNKSWLVREAMRTYNEAIRAGQPGAAKQALELLGKLSGILVERKELRVIRSLSDLSDEELEAVIASDRSDGDEPRN